MPIFAEKPNPSQGREAPDRPRSGATTPAPATHADSILYLQRTAGNQAVQRLLAANAEPSEINPGGSAPPAPPGRAAPAQGYAQRRQGDGEERSAHPAAPVQLLSAPRAVQRTPSADEIKRAEAEHRAAQQRIYRLLEPDTVWDYARRGDPPPASLTPEERAKDPHVVFSNSVAWVRSGRVKFTVLSPAPDQSGAPSNRLLVFDKAVKFPNLGGSAQNTSDFEGKVDARSSNEEIELLSKPEPTETRVRELLRHEVQHVADAHTDAEVRKRERAEFLAEQPASQPVHADMSAHIWNSYQTEFRGYWLESIARAGRIVGIRDDGSPVVSGGSGGSDKWGSDTAPGGELKVSGAEHVKSHPLYVPEATIRLQNEKQTNIARFIIHHYFGMEETFLTSPLFRAKVRDLERPAGLNLVNSLRIERVHHAMQGPAVRQSLWLRRVTREDDVAEAVKALDETDIAFLKDRDSSKPFWDEAKRQMSQPFVSWMEGYIVQGKKDAPPPVPPAAPPP